jgi:hypothetical protein
MKQYLVAYLKESLESTKEILCSNNQFDEKTTSYLRGYVKALNEIINMPAVIHNRMDRENDKNYKQVISAYEQELREKELAN